LVESPIAPVGNLARQSTGATIGRLIGAVFGLTPARYQSGEINRTGAISRWGDEMMRVMLYEAAQIMLARTTKWSWLKAWAIKRDPMGCDQDLRTSVSLRCAIWHT
jgi:transposase